MKSICFFNTNKAWGGGERWVYDNALTALRKGYDVRVVTNVKSALGDRLENETDLQVHRQNVSNLSFLNPLTLLSIRSYFMRTRPDALVMSLPSDMKVGGMAARMAGVPTIIYRRGIALPVRNTALNRFLFGSVITHFMCNSEETRRLALKENPDLIPAERVSVNYNGVDVRPEETAAIAPAYQRQGDEIIIGNAGRLTEQKRQDLLLEAVARLKSRGHSVKLLLAGVGELEDALKQQMQTLGLQDDVVFLGFVKAMPALYNAMDFMAHTAHWEGFGYVLAESMAAGKPVVGFNVSSNPELIKDGETGYLVDVDDLEGFVDRMETLVVDAGLRHRMGEAGRQRVDALFSSDRAFERLIALFS